MHHKIFTTSLTIYAHSIIGNNKFIQKPLYVNVEAIFLMIFGWQCYVFLMMQKLYIMQLKNMIVNQFDF
jgi:hypothetical protein